MALVPTASDRQPAIRPRRLPATAPSSARLGSARLSPPRCWDGYERLSTNAARCSRHLLRPLVVIVLVPNFPTALVTLVFAGLSWTAVISTLIAELQLFLPVWVRARGIAVYMVFFTGSMTVGALIWGVVAEGVGLLVTFLGAAGLMVAGVVAGVVWKLPETGHLDREPAVYWPEPQLAFAPELDTGPVLVTVEYTVTPAREQASSKR